MKLDILYVNDVHGYLELHNDLFYNNSGEYLETVGGYARLATLINEVRKNNLDTLLFDGGDTFHGTFPVVDTKGQSLIPILNKISFNAMVGHWDFGYGPKQLKELLSQLNYPMLGINVYHEDGSLFLTPYIPLQVGALTIGVIGICSNIIGRTMPKHFSEGLKITDGIEELSYYVRKLKDEGTDLVVLLSHNGFPQDVSMLEKIAGIDICLSAHTHNRLYESILVNKTIVIQCGCHGSFLGHLQLEIENKDIKSHTYKLIKVDKTITPDTEVQELISQAVKPYRKLKENIVGTTDKILHRYNTLNSSMDDLLLSAVAHVSKCGIAFSNGWRYGVPINAGEITEFDLYNIIPMNPPVSTVELSGQEIIGMLEENLERTFSAEPMRQMGGYVKRCVGLRMNIRIENPKGCRIQEIYYDNKHLDPNCYYKVAFVTSQGVSDQVGRNREELKIKAVDAMIDFLKINPEYGKSIKKTFSLV